MNPDDSFISSPRCPHFLVVLFGTLEYDGRVRRMIEILSGLGNVTVVDVYRPGDIARSVADGVDRVGAEMRADVKKVAGHLRLWRVALKACCRVKPDVVVAEDYFTAVPGWLAAKLSRSRFIYDAHELIIPESGKRMSLRDRLWYLLERWVVPRAQLVIAANEERARLMAEHYHLSRVPEFMLNIPSQPQRDSGEKESFAFGRAMMFRNLEERIILYQGRMALNRGIERFLEAVSHLPLEFRLVLAGGGPDLKKIGALVGELGLLERTLLLGRVPNSQLPPITRACDIGIVAYPFSGLNNIYCSPNKIFEYAQAGLPIVATNQPPLKGIIERYKIGCCVGPDDSPATIARAMENVGNRRKENYGPALKKFLDDHRWEDEAERVRSSIRRLFLTQTTA